MSHRGMFRRKVQDTGLPFIFSVTVGAGQSFQLPTVGVGTYDAVIDWGDGDSDVLTVWNAPERTHTYAVSGTYDIRISGVFEGWVVNNYADRLKITEIKQWGILKMVNYGPGVYFYNASNMIITATDTLDVSGIVSAYSFWRGCSSITTIPGMNDWDWSRASDLRYFLQGCVNFNQEIDMDVPSATSAAFMFAGCDSLNSKIRLTNSGNITSYVSFINGCTIFNSEIDIDTSSAIGMASFAQQAAQFNHPSVLDFDVSNVTNMQEAFYLAAAFNQPIGVWNTASLANIVNMLRGTSFNNDSLKNWDVSEVTNGTNFLLSETLDTTFYDNLLISWAAQSVNSGVTMHFGGSKYTSGGAAEAARNILINTYGWSITDGGPA